MYCPPKSSTKIISITPYDAEDAEIFQPNAFNGTDIAIAQCINRTDFEKNDFVLAKQLDKPTLVANSFKEIMDSRTSKNNLYFCAVRNKIVKTNVARKIKFDEILRYYEDIGYTTALYSYINKFVFVKDAIYLWDKRKRETEGTLSTSYSSLPSDVIWKNYVVAYAEPLSIGNQDVEIAKTYKALKY